MSLHLRSILYVIGLILVCTSISMIFPLTIAIFYQEQEALDAFLGAFLCCLFIGGIFYLAFKHHFDPKRLRHREACAIVTISWIVIAGFAALPYLFSGSFQNSGDWAWFHNFTEAYFESMSGFTTTGATVLTDIEALPQSILLWRSETQWLGGMGIILLSIAILPMLGVGGMQLFKAEVPGISVDKITPRISETAKTLWLVYLLLSAVEFLLLILGKMSVFEALCHTFSTLSTGGFSPLNKSIEQYDNVYFEMVIVVFMILAGMNFAFLYKGLSGKWTQLLKDKETHYYLLLILGATLLIALNLKYLGAYDNIWQALRFSVFQVSSIITTTGFASINWEPWPAFSLCLLLLLMGIGGMAGSTAGGVKIIRMIILFKHAYNELYQVIHPHAVRAIKINERPLSREIIRSVLAFFSIFMMLIIVATLILTALGVDFTTALSAAVSATGNVGPGLNLVGAVHNYHFLPDLGKWVLIVCMLLGRLEMYTAFVMFIPEFWKK